MAKHSQPSLQALLDARFADAPDVRNIEESAVLRSMAARGSCRSFLDRPVSPVLLETLCAVALASPSKSDLQQRDIIMLTSAEKRRKLADLVKGQVWVADAPIVAIFCGNNRRQRQLHAWHDIPFANDHLDAFFNATVDAAIALSAFVTAGEAIGLGCCPISAVRNEAAAVSDLLGLPDHVFPVAGLALGHPAPDVAVSKRLPFKMTFHTDQYQETNIQAAVHAYDQDRSQTQPYKDQRYPEEFGKSATYGWSEDKTRQYSRVERGDFADFIRAKGFLLD